MAIEIHRLQEYLRRELKTCDEQLEGLKRAQQQALTSQNYGSVQAIAGQALEVHGRRQAFHSILWLTNGGQHDEP